MSIEPFNRLVKLAARALYDDVTTKGDSQPKSGRSDNRGIAIVVLDTLTRRQWVREEDLAKDLKVHSKQLRRTLRFFEEEKLVTRDHRRETAKGAKVFSAAVAATVDGLQIPKEGDEKIKLHTHSYCCLDYSQICDAVRYRLHRVKKKLKDELENKNTVQEYICPNCGKRYNALDALRLVSLEDEYFHCENCNGELVAESDNLAAQDVGDGDDNARRRRREKLKQMLQNLEVQFKPLTDQLNRVKDLPVPEFRNLQAWEALASRAGRSANGDAGANDSSRSSQGIGYGGTQMPLLGETKVEVEFSGEVKEEDSKSEIGNASTKVLPPWMIKEGMNLSHEQRGEHKPNLKLDGNLNVVGLSDDKKSMDDSKDGEKNIQDEYVKAYYAALLEKQQELAARQLKELSNASAETGVSAGSPSRQVGMKSKRVEEDEGDGGVEWEEAPSAGVDLNVEPDALGGDVDEDDIEWEEG